MWNNSATPPISAANAHLLSAFFTISYVGSLYIVRAGRVSFNAPTTDVPNGSERARLANEKFRNDPDVIRARLTAVTISTVISCGVVAIVLHILNPEMDALTTSLKMLETLGLKPTTLTLKAVLPYLLVPALYLGPLYCDFLSGVLPGLSNWSFEAHLRPKYQTVQGVRNYIVAPATEEIVFRSCIIGVLKLSGASMNHMVFVAPLWFCVAHFHHAWELFNLYGKTKNALIRASLVSLSQAIYTTLFGWFATFVLLRTGSIYPALFSHTFCNIMGLPSPGYYISLFPKQKLPIWIAHFAGIGLFAWKLGPWTAN